MHAIQLVVNANWTCGYAATANFRRIFSKKPAPSDTSAAKPHCLLIRYVMPTLEFESTYEAFDIFTASYLPSAHFKCQPGQRFYLNFLPFSSFFFLSLPLYTSFILLIFSSFCFFFFKDTRIVP
jgi:hypothetical protein